jgi:hypothetical protein
MKSCYRVSNITSNDSVSLKIEAKHVQQGKKITWDLRYLT